MLTKGANGLRTSSSKTLAFLAAVFLLGCSAQKKGTTIPKYEDVKKEELAKGPLVDDPVEKKYKFLQGGRTGAVPVNSPAKVWSKDKDGKKIQVSAPWGAVVIDEKKTAEIAAIKAQRDRLLKDLQAERLRARTKEVIYKAALEAAKEKAERTWWERNKAIVAGSVFLTIGVAATVGLVYALTKGSGITINTNPAILRR